MVNFTFLLLQLILADQLADLSPYKLGHLVEKNGNSTFLPIAANTGRSTGRSNSPVESTHDQFYISTIRANIGRSPG